MNGANDMEKTPSIGRIVHYVAYGTPGGEYPTACRAAVVTEVKSGDVVGLAVVNPTGLFFNPTIPHGLTAGRWHWHEECPPPVAPGAI